MVVRDLPASLMTTTNLKVKQISSRSCEVHCPKTQLNKLMLTMRQQAVVHHSYHFQGNEHADFLITDRIFLTFKPGQSNVQIAQLIDKYGLIVRRRYKQGQYLCQLTQHSKKNPLKLVVELVEKESKKLAEVDHDLNYKTRTYDIDLPTDQLYNAQWHLHKKTASNSEYDPRSSSNCEQAWKNMGNFGNNKTVICISDDGCDLNHQDFSTPGKIVDWAYMDGINLIKRSDAGANPFNMYKKGQNHGTACAGVAAAEIDGIMTVGAAPNSRLLPIKWETSDEGEMFISDSKLLEVLNFVGDKIDVMSNSWGDVPTSSRSPQVTSKVTELAKTGGRRGKGIVFLWSAGNENCPIHHESEIDVPFDAGYYTVEGESYWIVSKAKNFFNSFVYVKGVILVGAIASTAQRSHYSNYGTGLTLCGPSSNRHTYNRLDVEGKGIVTTLGGNTTRTDFGGTSSATPLIAGIAALVISANPTLTAIQIVEVLKKTASKDLNMTGYPKTPYSPNWDQENKDWDVSPIAPFNNGIFRNIPDSPYLWSPWFGFGKVDAGAAVSEAIRLLPAPIKKPKLGKNNKPQSIYQIAGKAHFHNYMDINLRGGYASGGLLFGRKLKGLELIVQPANADLNVEYKVIVEDSGDLGWMSEGQLAGSTSGSAKIEAFAVRLTGPNANRFNVLYRAVIKKAGLTKLSMNGAWCGSKGGRRIEVIMIKIV